MGQLTVQTKEHLYDIHIGTSTYTLFNSTYKDYLNSKDKIAIIVDEVVAKLYRPLLAEALSFVQQKVDWLIIPSGEKSKNIETYAMCHSFLLQNHFTRQSLIIAFGGGACGDLAGFVAATFMRGIDYIQCPTTILAHDSAVGGKTAINMPEGKNMVGAFHQPKAVLFQTGLFQTLPEEEIRSGLAELLKHALISDEQWALELMANESFTRPTEAWLSTELLKGTKVKADIVEADEFEQSTRKYLNFGHTFGHAIEGVCGYGSLTHGEAIMIGMAYSLLLSERFGHTKKSLTDQFIAFAKKQGYLFTPVHTYPFEQFMSYMKKDKKMAHGNLNFVLLNGIGNPFVKTVTEEECLQVFQQLIKRTG